MSDRFSRREFLRRAGIAGVSAYGLSLVGDELLGLTDEAEAAARPVLAVASKRSPETLVRQAVNGLGGIKKFVRKGAKVVIKPNLAWARTPEQAANTNPNVISGIAKLCKEAGAGSILIVDHTCDNWSAAFRLNGADDLAGKLKVRVVSAHNHSMYKKVSIPRGRVLRSDECIREILEADCFINVPVAKVHAATPVTAAMKNMMGTNWNRQAWHQNGLDECIADYCTAVKPHLIILDANRLLVTRGPKGPGDIKELNQVVAGTDMVAMDAYACALLGRDPSTVDHIVLASKLGVGQIDLKKVTIKKV